MVLARTERGKAMRSNLIFAIAAMNVADRSPAWAALAPNYQRAAEQSAILAHPDVIGSFGMIEPIDRIEYVRPDLYRVIAGRCHIEVAIVDRPARPGIVGARQFEVRPSKKICG